jgi:hypothetical protein
MKRRNLTITLATALILLAAPIGTVDAGKKHISAKVGMTFVNTEPAPAYGLHVTLSGPSEVLTDAETGAAGPFRNVQGNGSNHVILTNPEEPLAGAGEGKVDLSFTAPKKKLEITGWWWVDEKGKRIGKKQKP